MPISEIIAFVGGYTVLIVGISGWIGAIVSKRIILAAAHRQNVEIESLKKSLELDSHEKKLSLSSFNESRTKALEEVHHILVELELFVKDQLKGVRSKWQNTLSKAEKEKHRGKGEPGEKLSGVPIEELKEFEAIQDQSREMKSRLAFAVGTLEFIAYEAFSKWDPHFSKFRHCLLKNEIYIDPQLFSQILELLRKSEEILLLSVRSIASVGMEVINGDGSLQPQERVDEVFSKLTSDLYGLFKSLRGDITAKIRNHLTPSS